MSADWIVPAAKAAIPILTSLLKTRAGADAPDEVVVASNIDRHMSYAVNWSGTLQIFDMTTPRELVAATLPLGFSTQPRRFLSQSNNSQAPMAEDDLLSHPANYLILGDVGAGKTTSIKRLVQRLLLTPPNTPTDTFSFPIVIVCRELGPDGTLPVAVATRLGIPFSDAPKGGHLVRPLKNHFWCGNTPLVDAVVEFINRANAILFVDGVDELSGELRNRVEKDLVALACELRNGKIVASLRAGDFRHIPRIQCNTDCPAITDTESCDCREMG